MSMYYTPDEDGFSPSGWLGTVADIMHGEYLQYWEQTEGSHDQSTSDEQRERFGRLVALADALRPTLHSLAVDEQTLNAVWDVLSEFGTVTVNLDYAGKIARAFRKHPIIEHGVQIALAQEATDGLLAGAEARLNDLLELVAERKMSERAAAYLDRATRLYLWGFEPEAVVMCGAVLEAAYEERFTDLEMFRLQIRKTGAQFDASQYEHAAGTAGVLSSGERRSARDIRRARNDVLHAVPSVALSAKEALSKTAVLLERLFPR